MAMNNVLKCGLAGTALLVSACGSSSSDTTRDTADPVVLISAEENALRVFADNGNGGTQDVADVLAGGGVLVARQVAEATIFEDYSGPNDTNTVIDGDVRLQLDPNNPDDLLVTFQQAGAATPTVFTIEDATSLNQSNFLFSPQNSSERFDIFIGGGKTFQDLLNDTQNQDDVVRVGIYYRADGVPSGLSTRVIIGTETTDERVNELIGLGTSVDYSGFGSVEIRQADAGFDDYNAQVSGNMTMTADFGARSVSGEMADPSFRERINGMETNETLTGSILFNDATIRDNAFVGSVTVDSTLANNDPTAAGFFGDVEYGGALYGADGDTIAGAVSGTGSADGSDFVFFGNFDLTQDP